MALKTVLKTMSRVRLAVTLFVVIGAVGAGMFLSKPALEDINNRWGNVSDAETELITNVVFVNPNPLNISLGKLRLEYTVDMNDIEMARGVKRGVSIRSGNNTFTLRTTIDNKDMPAWWISHINNEETTAVEITPFFSYGTFDLTQYLPKKSFEKNVETEMLERMQIDEPVPIRWNGQTVLVLESVQSNWVRATEQETTLETHLTLRNPNTVPVPLTRVDYALQMNDLAMLDGTSKGVAVIPPGGTETVRLTTHMQNQQIDEWWVTHLQSDEYTDLELQLDAVVEFSSVKLAFDMCDYQRDVYTDFLDYRGNRTAGSQTTCMRNVRSIGDITNTTGDLINGVTGSESDNTDESDSGTLDDLLG